MSASNISFNPRPDFSNDSTSDNSTEERKPLLSKIATRFSEAPGLATSKSTDCETSHLSSQRVKIILQDGSRYEGDVVNGKMHGKGTVFFIGGERYEGDFVHGKMHGRGTHLFENGELYIGTFAENRIEGQGVHYYKRGERYEGGFHNGKKHGEGTYFFNDGDFYNGHWDCGYQHGTGIYYNKRENTYYSMRIEQGVVVERKKLPSPPSATL